MSIDLTSVTVALVGGLFSVASIMLPYLINARMKDKQAAATLSDAVKNSLGALEQASELAVKGAAPKIAIPTRAGVPPETAAAVQYVLDHAGSEAARFGITPAAIADKVDAQIGLAKIATSPSPAVTAPAKVPA